MKNHFTHMLIFSLTVLLLTSCATSSKKAPIDPEKVENKDFQRPRATKYNQTDDYFKAVDSEETAALNDESMARIMDVDDVSDEDIFSSIAKSCYAKDYDNAWGLIRANHDKYRVNPAFWNQVGTCHLRRKEFRKALLFYNKSLEFKSNYVPALNNIGVMYWQQKQHAKALVAFRKAIESGRFAKTPRFNLALLYLQYGISDKAQATLERLVKMGKTDVDVISALATANSMKQQYKSAIRYCESVKDYYERAHVGINCALSYYFAGKYEMASDVISDVDQDKLGSWKSYFKKIEKKIYKKVK